MDLLIEGDRESLEWLREEIESRLGRQAELEPTYELRSGAFSEPILIALIVALGGRELTLAIRDIIARRYEHLEKMRQLEQAQNLKLKLLDEDTERAISLEQLPEGK
jgi:hypothetical protein